MDFKDKKVLVSGMAKSGVSAARLLKSVGAVVTVQDSKTEDKLGDEPAKLREEGINLFLGANPDDIIGDMDALVMSPGVPTDLPFVEKARANGIPVMGEIELAYGFCKGQVIGITGTNGKTTTTTLVGEIMKAHYANVAVVGNIGNPFADEVGRLTEDGWAVAELSSFQLETIDKFHPSVSAVLNITPDHLNRHHTMENYIAAKERVFENQTAEDYCILNYNDEATKSMAEHTAAKVIYFSLDKEAEGEYIYSDEKSIYIRALGYDQKVIDIDKLHILGGHNVENAMAAVGCTLAAGVPMETVVDVLGKFTAVEHRIEFVETVDGVDYYNDSKGTNPDASIKAVLAMRKPICLIAGGYDKGSDFDEWVELFPGRVKFVAVIGAVKDKVKSSLDKVGFENYTIADSFEQAVELCRQNAKSGDCVLLSPACASWDMFKSYEQRGEIFKDIVRNMK
jgi:UDP-N-acetylmuramoylalanine--D-glutamate ligase